MPGNQTEESADAFLPWLDDGPPRESGALGSPASLGLVGDRMTDMEQTSMFNLYVSPPPPTRPEQLFDEWLTFHESNPMIYIELCRMALELLDAGRSRYGIHGLFEVLRWHRARLQTTDEEFKINDHHAPFYARLLMIREAQLEGFFTLKNEEKYAPLMARFHKIGGGS